MYGIITFIFDTGIPNEAKIVIIVISLAVILFSYSSSIRNLLISIVDIDYILKFFSKKSKITKKLGDPDNITEEGIQQYYKREKLQLEELFKEANQEILFVGLSNEIIIKFNLELLKNLIFRGLKITIISLNPESTEVFKQEEKFGQMAKNLKNDIIFLLKTLYDLKTTLSKEYSDKLIIKTFDSKINYSYIVIDSLSNNPIIKIEHHKFENLNQRISELAYRKDCNYLYEQHWNTIKSIKVNDFNCNLNYRHEVI